MCLAGCSSYSKTNSGSSVYPKGQAATGQSAIQPTPASKYVTDPIPYINTNGMPMNSFFDLSFYPDLTFGQAISFEATFTKELTGVYITCIHTAENQRLDILKGATISANTSIIIDLKHLWPLTRGDVLIIKADGYNDFTYQIPSDENGWDQFLYQVDETTKFKMAKLGKAYIYMDPNGTYHTMRPDSIEIQPNAGSASVTNDAGGSNESSTSGSEHSKSDDNFLKQQRAISEENLQSMQDLYKNTTLETLKPFILESMKKQQKVIDEIDRKLAGR